MLERAMEGKPDVASLPETVNLMDLDRPRSVCVPQEEDVFLAAMRRFARERSLHLHLGSLALASPSDPSRRVNRSFWIDASGSIVGHYDKIHLFDVDLEGGESYRESALYEAGRSARRLETPWGGVGLTICYDLRFPALFRGLAQRGARVVFVPAAFTRSTGEKHWHALLRARAIECRCFIAAAAQGGKHEDGRSTFGHSAVVSPDGEIVGELAHDEPGVLHCRVDPEAADRARKRIPSLEDGKFSFDD